MSIIEAVEIGQIDRKAMQYLYRAGDAYYFMDLGSYQQMELSADIVGDALTFVKENEECIICSVNNSVIGVEAPVNVNLRIIETEITDRENAGGKVLKNAVTETGARIQVPLFINEGDMVKIDTRTGEFLGRA